MDLHLQGHTALIVGGARGIGRAIAEQFAREGASVVLWDRDPSVAETAHQIRRLLASDARAMSFAVDVTDTAEIDGAIQQLEQDRVDITDITYAAGIGSGEYGFPYWNVSVDRWGPVWEVNVMGAVRVAHRFGPDFAAKRRGTFLLIASVAGQVGSPTDPPYSAAKAAVINFAQCMAQDLAKHSVRVNTICPGMIQTELNRGVWEAWHRRQAPGDQLSYEDWGRQKVDRVTPLGRWQSPDDIARMAVFLASPMAENITGQTLNVDGGQVMHW